jgi:hypothetical protein
MKQTSEGSVVTARLVGSRLQLDQRPASIRETGDEPAVGEEGGAAVGVGCPSSTTQTTGRPGRWLEGLGVAVLIALGERDAAVRDTERRVGQALQTMTMRAYRCSRRGVVRQRRPYGAGGPSSWPW